MTKEPWSSQDSLEMLWRKLQPGSFQEIGIPMILPDLCNFSSEFIISILKMERGRNHFWIMSPRFLSSFLSCSNSRRKPKEARKIKQSFNRYSCYKGIALVADLCGKDANLVALGIHFSLSWTYLLWGALYFGGMTVSKAVTSLMEIISLLEKRQRQR